MIPKPKIVLLMVLWIAAVLFGIFDVVGPILGAAPPQSNSTNGTAGTPGQDDTGTSGTDTDATNGSNSSGGGGGGIAYPYTKVIPEGIHQAYGTYHWFVYVLPLLYSLKLFLWCRKIKKKAAARKAFISQSLRTIPIYPYTKDTTPWTDSSVLGDGLYYALSGWPQAEPANRPEYGFFMCLGVAAHVGDGIRYYANVPVPPPAAAADKGSSTSAPDPATAAGATSPAPASAGDSSTSPIWRGLEEEIEEVGEDEDDDEAIEEVGVSPHSADEDEDDEEYSFTEGRPGTNILAPNPLKAENTKEAEVSAIRTDQGEGEGEAGKVKGDIEENIVDWQQRQEIEEEQEENEANVYSA